MVDHQPLKADASRDATDSIRGYVYQIYQSINAWIRLSEDELLYLEVAEDFDILSKQEKSISVQVKDTAGSGNITLRSPSVIEAINNFWGHQQSNTDRKIFLKFLTTSDPGHEKKSPFNGLPGIEYWTLAAKSKGEVGVLRDFLVSLPLKQDVIDFLKAANDEEIRLDLLTRIHWETGAKPLDALILSLKDSLICYGEKSGIPSYHSERALNALLAHLCTIITSKSKSPLKRSDFIRVFDGATLEVVTRREAQLFRSQQPSSGYGRSELFLPAIPSASDNANRDTTLSLIVESLNSDGGAFLFGSTGLGKSSLAELACSKVDLQSLWMGFRSMDPTHVSHRLISARKELESHRERFVLVLDDLDMSQYSLFQRELLSLLFHIKSIGALFLITGPHCAPQEMLSRLWMAATSNIPVPYFTAEDVEEILYHYGLDEKLAKFYGGAICATSSGHPQLVQATIRRLNSEGWSNVQPEHLLVPSHSALPPRDVQQRLLSQTPSDDARHLLYRLSLTIGPFPRKDAIGVAGIAPTIRLPGEAFDILVGPWIEKIGEDLFRKSPLVQGTGADALSDSERKKVHEYLALAPLQRKARSYAEVSDSLMHAFICRSELVMFQISNALMNIPIEHLELAADSCFWFPSMALGAGEYLFKENHFIDTMLRLSQFRIASNGKQTDKATTIANKLISMCHGLSEADRALTTMIYSVLLMDINTPLSPSMTVPCLENLYKLTKGHSDLQEIVEKFSYQQESAESLNLFQTLLQFEVSRQTGTDSLRSFLHAFDALSDEFRTIALKAFDNSDFTQELINGAWWRDIRSGHFDPHTAIDAMREAQSFGKKWGQENIVLFSLLAESVLFSENLNDTNSATQALNCAENILGKPRSQIQIAKAKIAMMQSDYSAVVSLLTGTLDDTWLNRVDASFAYRNLGIAEAKLGNWSNAKSAFLRGSSLAEGYEMMLTMHVGFIGDSAYAAWMSGDKAECVEKLALAIRKLENIPLNEDLKNRHVYATLSHLVAWLTCVSQNRNPSSVELTDPIPGMCASQEPNEKLATLDIKPREAIFSALFTVATALGIETVEGLSGGEESSPLITKISHRTARITALASGIRIEDGANDILNVIEAMALKSFIQEDERRFWLNQPIPKLGGDFWQSSDKPTVLALYTISLSIVALNAERLTDDLVSRWREDFKNRAALSGILESTIAIILGETEPLEDTLLERAADSLAKLKRRFSLPLLEVFRCHYSLINAVHNDLPSVLAGDALASLFSTTWLNTLQNQKFLLKSPFLYTETIEKACRNADSGISKAAHILLAVAPAVGATFATGGREFLERLATPNP